MALSVEENPWVSGDIWLMSAGSVEIEVLADAISVVSAMLRSKKMEHKTKIKNNNLLVIFISVFLAGIKTF
jgi:hypothetical protein